MPALDDQHFQAKQKKMKKEDHQTISSNQARQQQMKIKVVFSKVQWGPL
jgi:hypothetical protein